MTYVLLIFPTLLYPVIFPYLILSNLLSYHISYFLVSSWIILFWITLYYLFLSYLIIYYPISHLIKHQKPKVLFILLHNHKFSYSKIPVSLFLPHHILTCLKISSSSLRLRISTCLLPLSSASRMRRCLSASMEKAWMRRSSCRRMSSFVRKSNMSPRLWLSTWDSDSSIRDSWNREDERGKFKPIHFYIFSFLLPKTPLSNSLYTNCKRMKTNWNPDRSLSLTYNHSLQIKYQLFIKISDKFLHFSRNLGDEKWNLQKRSKIFNHI